MALPEPTPGLESLLAHSDWLAALARRLVNDRASADDLVQDTWVAALRNPPRETHSIRAWIRRVARRLARGRGARCETELVSPRDDAPPTDEVVARIEEERLLARLVLELDEPHRTVILRRFYAGLSSAEIARAERVPHATVRTRVRRALAVLRERLEKERGHDAGGWPLAAIVLARDTWRLQKANEGIVIMGTKSTIAASVASGALCAIAVTEGVLPRLEGRTTLDDAQRAAPVEGDRAPGAAPRTAQGEDAGSTLDPTDHAGASAAHRAPAPEHATELSPEELRAMLLSSERFDQIRAIRLLLQRGTDADKQLLVDTLLASKDAVLSSLIEEALLGAPGAFAPAVLAAFECNTDPATLARLGNLLAGFVERRPELEQAVVGSLIEAMRDADASPDRAGAAVGALTALGARAADEVASYLVDPKTGSKGTGSAAWVIAQLPAGEADLVREKLGLGLRSLDASDSALQTDEERAAVREKTGSVAWAASLRPESEHDRLGQEICDSLLRTRDGSQAGTLAWSIGNLKGLTDGARVDMSRELLGALQRQTDAGLRRQYAGLLRTLAKPGASTEGIVRLIQTERSLQSAGSPLAQTYDALLAELQGH